MRKTIFDWLGKEFIGLSSEGRAGLPVPEQTGEVFQRFDQELRDAGLSLEHTVRTRLWARDSEGRNLGSAERVKILSGRARSASSSFIAPIHFDSEARVALDLLAMRPSRPSLAKTLKEYDPPIVPLRYLIYDEVVVLSGVTSTLPALDQQVAEILSRISGSLAEAGASWEKVVKVSFFLHRGQKLEALKESFGKVVQAASAQAEYALVDGYSAAGKLIEIEVTATR